MGEMERWEKKSFKKKICRGEEAEGDYTGRPQRDPIRRAVMFEERH